SPLPTPRSKPLKPGGVRESELIQYLDGMILGIKRRWAKRMFKDSETGPGRGNKGYEAKGYKGFGEVVKDVEEAVDIVWVSGSPNLQIPYLLNIALLVVEILPDFPPAPQSTFLILDKLDHAFTSLLQGKDSETGEPLPGFDNGRRVNTTEKVRLKSLVERTRITAIKVLSGNENVDEEQMGEDDLLTDEDTVMRDSRPDDTVKFEGFDDFDDDDDEGVDGNGEDDPRKEWHVMKIYENTLGELGDVLGGSPIGIITDE
ncbi:hypothetical protein P154DRAFT_406516, partial [Amniculicola lignicola CBS 123094]